MARRFNASGPLSSEAMIPASGAVELAHDAYNRRTETTDPNGVKTLTTYDALGRVRKPFRSRSEPTRRPNS